MDSAEHKHSQTIRIRIIAWCWSGIVFVFGEQVGTARSGVGNRNRRRTLNEFELGTPSGDDEPADAGHECECSDVSDERQQSEPGEASSITRYSIDAIPVK